MVNLLKSTLMKRPGGGPPAQTSGARILVLPQTCPGDGLQDEP